MSLILSDIYYLSVINLEVDITFSKYGMYNVLNNYVLTSLLRYLIKLLIRIKSFALYREIYALIRDNFFTYENELYELYGNK